MKRGIIIAVLFCVVLFVAAVLVATASEPQSKAGIEKRKIEFWHGEWTYTGKSFTTPLGPGASFTGKLSGRPVQDGFGSEFIYTEGGTRYLEIDFWEQATQQYNYIFLGNDGYAERGSFKFKGDECVFEGSIVSGEKVYKVRGIEELSSDGQSFFKKSEVSADGITWTPLNEATFTRIKPAAKK